MVRNSVFRPGFGQPLNIELYVERLIALFTSIPAFRCLKSSAVGCERNLIKGRQDFGAERFVDLLLQEAIEWSGDGPCA
jgi:hypothetical protein